MDSCKECSNVCFVTWGMINWCHRIALLVQRGTHFAICYTKKEKKKESAICGKVWLEKETRIPRHCGRALFHLNLTVE